MAEGPSIIDRLMGRGRKPKEEEDSTDESAPPPEEGADGATGTGDDVEGTVDETQGTVDDTAPDDAGGEVNTGDGTDQSVESDADIVSNESGDDGGSAIYGGDGVTETSGDISDGTQTGDAIGGDGSTGAIVSNGDTPPGTGVDPITPRELDDPIGPFTRAREPAKFDPGEESELEQQLREIEDATENQLDPAIVQGRLGGRGPEPPDPDDGGDNLGFGTGASTQVQGDQVLMPVDADPPLEAPEGMPDGGFGDVGPEPVGGVPPDDGLPSDPTQIQIDDPGPHDAPTEVDID